MGIKLGVKKSATDRKVAEIKKATKEDAVVQASSPILVPTPSTILNLRCSGSYKGAFKLGTMANLIGDSHAGKTLIALGVLAECSIHPYFDDYDLVYNDTENAYAFDTERMFGSKLNSRLEIINTKYHEYFESDIKKRLDAGKKIIYILDSFDGMTTLAAEELRKENIKRQDKGLDKKDSFGDGKPKLFSQFGGTLTDGLADTESFCLIISQTRQNIGPTSMFNPKIRSGGDALKFFAFHEIWLTVKAQEKHSVHKNETIRSEILARVKKNKLIGRSGIANISILHQYGVDNVRSSIDYMLECKFWSGSASSIDTKGFYPEKTVSRSKLIEAIEAKNKEVALAKKCQEAYDKLMSDINPTRKKRY